MKIAVVGSRTFEGGWNYEAMASIMLAFGATEIISGGAPGADRLAERYAVEKLLPLTVLQADWDALGKSAGFERNKLIVQACDGVVAFWDGQSRGTKHTMSLCWKAGKPLAIIRTDMLIKEADCDG